MASTKKLTPSDLSAQAQQLIYSGRLPSLDEVLKAVSETRAKYAPLRCPSDFQNRLRIHGLRVAAEKTHREEFNRIVAPPPVQLQFPFLAARAEKEVR